MFANQSTRRRPLYLLAATLLTTVAAACGGGDSTGPSPAPGGGGNTVANVTVVNSAQAGSVLFLRARACGALTWGSDLLGSSVLSQGEQGTWEFAPGCYEFRATPAEVGLDYLYFNNVQLDAGEAETLTITAFPLEP